MKKQTQKKVSISCRVTPQCFEVLQTIAKLSNISVSGLVAQTLEFQSGNFQPFMGTIEKAYSKNARELKETIANERQQHGSNEPNGR